MVGNFGLGEKTHDYSIFRCLRSKIGERKLPKIFGVFRNQLRSQVYDVFRFVDASHDCAKHVGVGCAIWFDKLRLDLLM
ncbi:hypothetical protein MIDIC_240006 [Alphaproteobacteria bacterium]